MPKRLKKVLFKTRDENGNYVTIDMSTGLRKTNFYAKQSTTINKPQIKWSIKRTLKPGEQVFTDWRTGKKTVFTPRRAEVKSDNRNEYQKQKDQKTADILHQKHEQEKTTQEGLKNLEAIVKVISPSTYIGPLANRAIASIQGDKQDRRNIGEQILSGEGTGDTAGNLLLDFASPYAFSKLQNAIKQLYKATRYVNNKVLDNLTWYQRLPNGRYTMGEPVFPDKTIQIKPSTKQQRLQLKKPTWQIYPGKTHKISEVIDDGGNVNLANLFKIQNEALSNVPGGRLARHRLENPDWHKTDWNTFLHSRDAYQRALQAGYPNEALFPTLMHDAGKLWAGDGHGPYGASIVKQIFPDATDEQIMAIYQHMDKIPESSMGKLVKGADIAEDNPFRNYSWINSNDGYPYALRPGQNSWDTNVIQNELQQGRKDLLDWVNNPEFIKAQQANKIEAQNMGLEYIPLHERSTFKDRVALLDNPGTYNGMLIIKQMNLVMQKIRLVIMVV